MLPINCRKECTLSQHVRNVLLIVDLTTFYSLLWLIWLLISRPTGKTRKFELQEFLSGPTVRALAELRRLFTFQLNKPWQSVLVWLLHCAALKKKKRDKKREGDTTAWTRRQAASSNEWNSSKIMSVSSGKHGKTAFHVYTECKNRMECSFIFSLIRKT